MRRLSGSILCAFTLAALTVSGCHQEPMAPKDLGPISLIVVSGGGQSGVVGAELRHPLVVKVNNSAGVVIPFLTVNFEVTSGGGSMFADAVTTDGPLPRGVRTN